MVTELMLQKCLLHLICYEICANNFINIKSANYNNTYNDTFLLS